MVTGTFAICVQESVTFVAVMIRRCLAVVPMTCQICDLAYNTVSGAAHRDGMGAREVFHVLASGSYSHVCPGFD